jgi:putative MATE family efflux protein
LNKDKPAERDRTRIDIETESRRERLVLIVTLALPALAEGLLTSLTSIVDMMMVGGLGTEAINAVGLCMQPKFIMLASFMALGVGTTALAARFKGARDKDGADSVFNQSLLLSAALVLLLCAVMLAVKTPLMRFIAGSELSGTSVKWGGEYFFIQIVGFPTAAVSFTITAALRGVGNTRASFYANGIANVVNVALNYCLITGKLGFPALGVAGASIATVAGQGVGLLVLVGIVLRGRDYVRFSARKLKKPDFDMIRRIVRVGVPALGEQAAMRIGMLAFTMIVTRLGDNEYSAHMIAINIQSLSFAPGQAFGAAATTLMGQCLGRTRPDLSRVYVNATQKIALGVSLAVAALLFFGGRAIAGMYITEPSAGLSAAELAAETAKNAAVVVLTARMLKIIALSNPFSNARFIGLAALRGAGDSKFAAVVTFVTVIFLRTVLSFLLTLAGLGLDGVWIALASDGVVAFFLAQGRYRRGKWAEIEV